MWKATRVTAVAVGLMLAGAAWGQAPTGAPAGATGLCKDGSYWSGPVKKGACHGHKGVQTWYGDSTASSAGPAAPAGAAAASAPPAAAAAATATGAAAPVPGAAPKLAASGGGPGEVWVNKNTKVYHCPADKWYGRTKNGAYMSEAEAKAQGFHPDHGKACP